MSLRPLGLWPDSRGVYAIGAFLAGMIGCAVIASFLGEAVTARGLLISATIPGAVVGLLLAIAGLVGFHLASGNPNLHPVLRWLVLCIFGWLVLGLMTVIVIIGHLHNILWLSPIGIIYAVWTALFLLGRRPC